MGWFCLPDIGLTAYEPGKEEGQNCHVWGRTDPVPLPEESLAAPLQPGVPKEMAASTAWGLGTQGLWVPGLLPQTSLQVAERKYLGV